MKNILFFLFASLLLFLACGKNQQKVSETKQTQQQVIAVKVEMVREIMFSEKYKVTGEVAPLWQVEIFPRVAGKVISKSCRLGERIAKGQILAEIIQDIPGMEYGSVKIEADVAGDLTHDWIEIGSMVSPQKPVFAISELQQVYVIAQVFEHLANQVRLGDAVMIETDALEKSINGRVVEINPAVQKPSRTLEVKILVDNSSRRLKPGMFAVCYFQSRPRPGMSIPLDAIIQSGANKYVYVVQQDQVRLQSIQTGIMQDQNVEVTFGLKVGDRVVVVGQNQLQDGAKVRVVEE